MNNIAFLSYRLHTSLSYWLIFILSGKNGKSLCKSCKSLGYSTSAWRIWPLSLSYNSFYELFIEFRYIFFHLKTIYRQFLRYCPSIQIVCIQIHEVSWFNVFIIIFQILTICLCIPTYSRYILPLIPFSVINNILISVNNSNFTSFF